MVCGTWMTTYAGLLRIKCSSFLHTVFHSAPRDYTIQEPFVVAVRIWVIFPRECPRNIRGDANNEEPHAHPIISYVCLNPVQLGNN